MPSARARASASARSCEKELASEEAALAKAQRRTLAAQEAVRSGDERNYARVEERLQPYKDSGRDATQKNIEALQARARRNLCR